MTPEANVLTVRQLNEAIQGALLGAFPAPVWVRGEIQRLPLDAARRKHVYFELHEARGGEAAAFQVPVALLGWDRDRFGLGRYLDGSDPRFPAARPARGLLPVPRRFLPAVRQGRSCGSWA